ncbi:pre-rRNA-processing protein TSR2 homolog [Punica granatum]|uniref:Pre-rRNA-processing protein TSR2 homolog n=1 Tax=Punica granatum TaxID=22663 RepID=A0A218WNS4_PUNGR|nr:pre-rRNA-processing protein TSR2 homolog [Punica granatum]OWM74273.1 hypothetical protein CDL15_Pgr008587 [Punica granatum]
MELTMSGSSDMTLGDCPSSSHHVRLLEGIALLLSGWHGLQLAIENQWGGADSVQKYHQLIVDIFSWFSSRSKASLCVEELENVLHESMLLSFNTEIEDGSIEEVAEQLMILYEEYAQTTRTVDCL